MLQIHGFYEEESLARLRFGNAQCPACSPVVNYKEQVHDATSTHSLYHLLHNGEQNKAAEPNKGKAPLGEAVEGL